MDNPSDFFSWLAAQPPCVEVALGAFFCLFVAPVLLGGVATTVTALEAIVETRLIAFFASRHAARLSRSSSVRTYVAGIRKDALP